MTSSLVGSEMCIRDRSNPMQAIPSQPLSSPYPAKPPLPHTAPNAYSCHCLLYTSDAADDM
eukprot:7236147-Prorocentrum_lima.AAC.1